MKNVSKAGYWVVAAFLTLFLLGLQIGADLLESHYGARGVVEFFDEALIALVFSGLVMHLIRKSRIEREQHARAIRAMNHHVRNALQSILYADHLGGPERKQKYIAESVNRIERAVWEVSNGVETEDSGRELTRMNAN